MINIGMSILGIIILTVILKITSEMTKVKGSISRLRYIQLQIEKVVDTDFKNIDGPIGQERFMKAIEAI